MTLFLNAEKIEANHVIFGVENVVAHSASAVVAERQEVPPAAGATTIGPLIMPWNFSQQPFCDARPMKAMLTVGIVGIGDRVARLVVDKADGTTWRGRNWIATLVGM